MKTLEFWFEFASPYSYLSAMRIEQVASHVVWRPFLLGPIFNEIHGSSDSPFNRNPARLRYMWIDVAREANKLGLALRPPTTFPRGSLLATRVAVLGEDQPWIGAFVRAIFTANFAHDTDIGDHAVVLGALEPLVAAPGELIAQASGAQVKERLRARSREAAERGIFGAPTFFVGDQMYWGNDRLDDALV